jgi:hypothetical protein
MPREGLPDFFVAIALFCSEAAKSTEALTATWTIRASVPE